MFTTEPQLGKVYRARLLEGQVVYEPAEESDEGDPPTHCQVCGMPPMDKSKRPLKWNERTKEWYCDVCEGKNELPCERRR